MTIAAAKHGVRAYLLEEEPLFCSRHLECVTPGSPAGQGVCTGKRNS